MRHYMVDPDNEERLLKIPPSVVAEIQAAALQQAREERLRDAGNGIRAIGRYKGLRQAREAIEAIPSPYKVIGQHETYDSYHEGRADFKDAALSAIDALREDRETPPPLPPSVGVPERRWT